MCQINRFQLLDTSPPKDLPYSAIGIDLFWQWVVNFCLIGSQQLSLALTSNLSQVKLLSYLACITTLDLTQIPGRIFAWYLIMFGSRYIGDRRYEQFWGLVRAMLIGMIIVMLISVAQTPRILQYAIGVVVSPKDQVCTLTLTRTPSHSMRFALPAGESQSLRGNPLSGREHGGVCPSEQLHDLPLQLLRGMEPIQARGFVLLLRPHLLRSVLRLRLRDR